MAHIATVQSPQVCLVCDRVDVVSLTREGDRLVARCSCGALAARPVHDERHAA